MRELICVGALAIGTGSCAAWADAIGAPISSPAALNGNCIGDSGADLVPRLACDGAGHWIATWQSNENLGGVIGNDYDILTTRSADNGLTWSSPAPLNSTAGADDIINGHDKAPDIATDGHGLWIVVWQSVVKPDGSASIDQDIVFSRSVDNGATWSPPAYLASNAASDEGNDLNPVVRTDGNGVWVVAWETFDSQLGTIGADGDILTVRSIDGGLTWSIQTPLNPNASIDSKYDLRPKLECSAAGAWLCVWQSKNPLNGASGSDDDIHCSRSADGGQTWSAPQPVNSTAGSDLSIDADADPHAACDGAGRFIVVWSSTNSLGGTIGTDMDIFVSRSLDGGVTWSSAAPLNSDAAADGASKDQLPRIAADPLGHVICVWHTNDSLGGAIGTDDDVMISLSQDGGVTWTSMQPLNTNAATDVGPDDTSTIASDRHGGWIAAWEKNDAAASAMGADGDLLLARFALPDCNQNTLTDALEPDADSDGVPDGCDEPGDPCPPDISPSGGDRVVNIDDLFGVINAWGPCGGPSCAADVSPVAGDGLVNIDDLFVIINNWGPCP